MKNPNIGIATFPAVEANVTPLSNSVDISRSISKNLYIITGDAGSAISPDHNKIHIHLINHKIGSNAFTRITNYAYTQLRILYKVARLSKNVDVWLFPVCAEALLPAMLMAKLFRKPVVLALTGSVEKMVEAQNDFLDKVVVYFVKINYALSDHILIYSKNLIKEWGLEKYKNKISIAHEHFLDFDKFKINKKFEDRDNLIGYIGRFSKEKGTLNFIKAIFKISKEKDDIRFIVGGDGPLRGEIEKYLTEKNSDGKVKFVGWIAHDELPDYLNELKLVVLPSYTEGLPNLMLEAMACGTPVLATPVGAIPDIIKDGQTGFILENNSPKCIAENVVRALKHPHLDMIVKNAREQIGKEFTFGNAVERYRKIFTDF